MVAKIQAHRCSQYIHTITNYFSHGASEIMRTNLISAICFIQNQSVANTRLITSPEVSQTMDQLMSELLSLETNPK